MKNWAKHYQSIEAETKLLEDTKLKLTARLNLFTTKPGLVSRASGVLAACKGGLNRVFSRGSGRTLLLLTAFLGLQQAAEAAPGDIGRAERFATGVGIDLCRLSDDTLKISYQKSELRLVERDLEYLNNLRTKPQPKDYDTNKKYEEALELYNNLLSYPGSLKAGIDNLLTRKEELDKDIEKSRASIKEKIYRCIKTENLAIYNCPEIADEVNSLVSTAGEEEYYRSPNTNYLELYTD